MISAYVAIAAVVWFIAAILWVLEPEYGETSSLLARAALLSPVWPVLVLYLVVQMILDVAYEDNDD